VLLLLQLLLSLLQLLERKRGNERRISVRESSEQSVRDQSQ